MSDRMEDIRNEDYVKLMGFYANPERYTKTYQPNADGKQRATKTIFNENYKDVKKSLDRFEESYGGYDIKEEGEKQRAKLRESQDFSDGGQLGYARDLLANGGAGSYAKGTNPFFEAFESYDPRANMRDDIKSLQSQISSDPKPEPRPRAQSPQKPRRSSQEFKDKIIANVRARQAVEKEPPTITTKPPAPTPPPKEVPGPGTTPPAPPPKSGGGGYRRKNKAKPISDEVIEDIVKNGGKYVDNSFSARDINQSIGKVGDINTSIVDSTFGDNAVIGNDQSETSGEQRVGNDYDEYELNLPKGGSGGGGEVIDNGFSARDINENIGKVGDINTDIQGSTFGDGAVIGNDYSQTSGTQNVGNTYSSRKERRGQAKQKAKMFSKGGMFDEGGVFGGGGLRFS